MPQQGPQAWPQRSLSCLGRAGCEQQELQMPEPCLSSQPATCTPCHQDTTGCKRVCLRSGKAHGYLGHMQVLVFQDKGINSALGRAQEHECGSQGTQEEHTWLGAESQRGGIRVQGSPGKGHSTSSNSRAQTLISPPFHYAADTRSQ